MKILLNNPAAIAVALSLASVTQLHSEVVADPIQAFLSLYDTSDGIGISRIDVDFDGDGRRDALISLNPRSRDRSGQFWSLYLGVPGGFIEPGGVDSDGNPTDHPFIVFRADAYFVGNIAEMGGRGLLSYVPGSAVKGFMVGHKLVNGKVKDVDLGAINFPADQAKYDKYFKPPPSTKVKKLPIP